MNTKTAEQHDSDLREFERQHLLQSAQDARAVLADNMRWQAAEALAERDAAREELAQARNRIEFLENGAAPVDAAQPAEDVAPKLREALALSLGADPSRPIWALVNEAIGRIRFLEVAAHPEPAPVVGGVTEAMLDEIVEALSGVQTRGLHKRVQRARDAIRAQKRVDVEEIRGLINRRLITGYSADCLLRAIGDEPAEAPVNSPGIQDGSIAEAPVAEPAAPAQEQEGPWHFRPEEHDRLAEITNLKGCRVRLAEDGGFDSGEPDARRIVSLLNEAPKLRARVAELETERERLIGAINSRQEQVVAAATERGELFRRTVDAEARADAAEAKLAALGGNPIPRALGERWHSYASGLQSGAWFAELLAGREPGVAS